MDNDREIHFKSSIEEEVRTSFLDLFYEPDIDQHSITLRSKISLYTLRFDGTTFDYNSMKSSLLNATLTYVFSRMKYDSIPKSKMGEYAKEVRDKFRKAESNRGEAGELFLYCFLETHLNAPKILSKMELKTSENDYVKKSDGIHLLKLSKNNYQLIFGESKMIGDSTEPKSSFRKAIVDSLNSIKQVVDNGIADEIGLVDSNLMKEAIEEELLEFLKKIIKPTAKGEITKSNAFGIFTGFEIDVTDWDIANLEDSEFQDKVRSEVRTMVSDRYDFIKNKIKELNLDGFHYYIYAVPFIKKGDSGIEQLSMDIIEHFK